MSERPQVNPSSAVTAQHPSAPGSVAPPQPERSDVPPGAVPQPQPSQPGQPVAPVAQDAPPSAPPQNDLAAQLARERAERERLQNETRQYQQAINQVQQYAQQQQQTQQLQNQVNMILATADTMSSSDGAQYLRNQITNMIAQQQIEAQRALQQRDQQFDQERRQIAAPLYADHLIESLGIPPEAKQELLALKDPDLMYQMAPQIKARYEQFNQQLAQYQQGQQQLARSHEVNELRNNGLTNIGGQGAGASYDLEVSDDPDTRAMQILAHMRDRERQGLPPAVAIPKS
jgi:hypothetical protein